MSRGQSSVVGVALLVAVTVVALAGMTAAVGTVLEDRADAATADRAAVAFEEALAPTGRGQSRERVALPGGDVRVAERSVRVLGSDGTVVTYRTNALVYDADGRRAVYENGAVLRVGSGGASVEGDRPVRVSDGHVFVSVVVLGAAPGEGSTAESVTLRTNATHADRTLEAGDYRVAVETAAPDARAERLAAVGTTTRRDVDGDGVPSVVVDPAGSGPTHVLVHRLRLEVTAG
ncbi:MAG: archaellin/type IV pilin N-terminal domain-containing protein [Haloferacaceae archaeon]